MTQWERREGKYTEGQISCTSLTLRPGSVAASFNFRHGLGGLSLKSSINCTSLGIWVIGGGWGGGGAVMSTCMYLPAMASGPYHVNCNRSCYVRVAVIDVQVFPQLS